MNDNKYRCDLNDDMRMMIFTIQHILIDKGVDVDANYVLDLAIKDLFIRSCKSANIYI